jgi:hypothetical protein
MTAVDPVKTLVFFLFLHHQGSIKMNSRFANVTMYSLPREIHQEIIGWFGPETQQITRLTNRYFAGLIKPRDVDLLIFGAVHGILEYCEIGLSRGNSKMQVCNMAALKGHLEILQWARLQNCPWDKYTCSWAAKHGHLEVLKWARLQNCPWDEYVCIWSAYCGHLKVLKWAHFQGCPRNRHTCSYAAQGGHLEVLKWARECGYLWDTWTCTWAAAAGHLEVIKWALDNGCPWDFRTVNIS